MNLKIIAEELVNELSRLWWGDILTSEQKVRAEKRTASRKTRREKRRRARAERVVPYLARLVEAPERTDLVHSIILGSMEQTNLLLTSEGLMTYFRPYGEDGWWYAKSTMRDREEFVDLVLEYSLSRRRLAKILRAIKK